MTNQTTPTQPANLVKGSWEELLLRAQSFATRDSQDAFALFEKLVSRLAVLPAEQLAAGNGRLYQTLVRAASDYQAFLSYHDRYAEALAVAQKVRPQLADQHLLEWDQRTARIEIQAGQTDAGLARLHTLAEVGAFDGWGDLFFAALALGRLDAAAAAVTGAERTLNQLRNREPEAAELTTQQASVAFLKARLTLVEGKLAESAAWFEHAMALDTYYQENPQLLYTSMVERGAHPEALALIRRDQHNPLRAGFWHGLTLWRSGQRTEAKKHWQQVTKLTLPKEGQVDFLELVLSHYYLGDQAGVGLASALNTIRDPTGKFWGMFYLAGLGWALRGNVPSARANLRLAVLRRKALAEGRRLTHTWWRICEDLLEEATLAQIVEYFDPAPAALSAALSNPGHHQ